MGNNDVYIVKQKQTYFTEPCLNVWFYRQELTGQGGVDDAHGLFNAFDLDILSDWAGMVSTSISITEVEVFQIEDPTDNFIGTPTNDVGTRALGDNLRAPSWVAAGFKSNRNGPGTRSSFKRFAGIGEVDIDDNIIAPAFTSLAATVALKAAMGTIVTSVGGNTYQPVQIKSGWTLGVVPFTNFDISSWIDPKLTSQVSRKP